MTIKKFKKKLKDLKPWKDRAMVFGGDRIRKGWFGYETGKIEDLPDYSIKTTKRKLIKKYLKLGLIVK